MRKWLRHSKPDLRGPRSGLELGPDSSGGVRFAALFAQMPNLPTEQRAGAPEALLRGVPGAEPLREG
eukprot:15476265-Alexandrium_andersonii.AAC.1